jgi:hypothetical protein
LGGFQGGGTAGLLRTQSLDDDPRLLNICDLNNYCNRPNVTAIKRTHIAGMYTYLCVFMSL